MGQERAILVLGRWPLYIQRLRRELRGPGTVPKIYAAPLAAPEASAAIEMNCGPSRKAARRSAVDPHLVLGEFLGE
jgi:hypothetical protein